jgi:hypothetical protein
LVKDNHRQMLSNFSVMATLYTSEDPVRGAVSLLIRPLLCAWADLSLYLHRPEDSTPSEQIEGHLSEKTIQNVFDYPGKASAKRMAMQVA